MSYKHFNKDERNELSVLLKKGYSLRDIGRALEKNPSSVSREVSRNSVKGEYNPRKADHKAYARRKYSKYQGMKVRSCPELEGYIREKIQPPFSWSPEQIAGRWKTEHPDKAGIAARGVYKYLYSIHGQLLCRYLKYKQSRQRKRTRGKSVKELIPNRVFIDFRPEIVNKRERFGDFEGDTMGRPRRASSQTLVVARERLSRKLFAIKVLRLKHAIGGFKAILGSLPVKSLTLDNGVENVRYEELEVPTYFCHPFSSWEKPVIENGIGVLRKYIPKKADLKDYSDQVISAILDIINSKPMKCLGWKTPNEVFEEELLNFGCCA